MKLTFDYYSDINIEYINDLIKNNIDDYSNFLDRFQEPKFSVAQIGVSRQELLNWRKQGLIPQISQLDAAWTRVGYFTYTWIRMIAELRKLNVPIDIIKKFSQHILKVDEDEYYAILKETLSPASRSAFPLKVDDIEDFAEFVNKMPEQVKKYFKERFNNFSLIILGSIFSKTNCSIFIDQEGNFFLTDDKSKNDDYLQYYAEFLKRPFYALPLSTVLREFDENKKIKSSDVQALFQLTEREAKVLSLLRRDVVKDVRVRLNNKNGRAMFLVEVVEKKNIAIVQNKIERIFENGAFKDMKIAVQNGNLVLFEEATTIKI